MRLGAYDFLENEIQAFDIGVHDIVIHPNFTADGWDNDIALLRLAESVTYSNFVRSLPLSKGGPGISPLPITQEGPGLEEEEECAVVSWHHRRE